MLIVGFMSGIWWIHLLSRPPPLTLLDLSHLLVSVYLPAAALSALGLFTNRIDCVMSHLAADRQSTFCIDLTIDEHALL